MATEDCLLHWVAPWYVTYDTRFYPGPYRLSVKVTGLENHYVCA